MSFNQATLENAFYSWASTVSGKTVIWRYQNAPRPAKPYLDLNIGFIQKVGADFEAPPDENGMTSLYGNRELTLEINFYGNDAMTTFEKLITSLKRQDIIQTFAVSGIVFVDKITENNATVLIDTTYEQRRILELQFRYSNQGVSDPDEYNVGLIEYVEMDGEITGSVSSEIEKHIEVGTPYTPP